MEKINWGIIGCGDVTEVKSGPAFNKISNSALVAVMRRNAAKAKDYAVRHKVPKYYDDAALLINDPEINAIYIATPPHVHEAYTLAAINAGKYVYVEKPMALNYASAVKMMEAAAQKNAKLVLAHYRNAQPLFIKIKQLLDEGVLGKLLYARLDYRQSSPGPDKMTESKTAWRLNPLQSGGGLFHDLAPHQLGLLFYFFGAAEKASGVSGNQSGLYAADDMVSGNILFKNGVQFSGSWCFTATEDQQKDCIEIFGTKGSLQFAVFSNRSFKLNMEGKEQQFSFDPFMHVQQPMIEKAVQYFLGNQLNPCPPEEGCAVMALMDAFTKK